jgi:hypothetical protein
MRVFKVHTDTIGRLCACIQKSMYGVSKRAFTAELPKELRNTAAGDVVFISEREATRNALFGPFFVVDDRRGVVAKKKVGCWMEVDVQKSSQSELAYWVEFEKRCWCLLFDNTLIDRISIVWPYNWRSLKVELPPWGLIAEPAASKLIDFAATNLGEVREFLSKHCV